MAKNKDMWIVEYLFHQWPAGMTRWVEWHWIHEGCIYTNGTLVDCVHQAKQVMKCTDMPVRLRHVATGNVIPFELL